MTYTIRNWINHEVKTFATIEEADAYADQYYLEKPARPRKPHVPLIVTPIPAKERSNNLPNARPQRNRANVVAFVERQLCFFDNDFGPPPPVGEPVEVMITRCLYRNGPEGRRDWSQLLALLIAPVTGHTLVAHSGFECSGSMCSTTASMVDPKTGEYLSWMTPGRCQIFEAGNVNAGSTWKQKYTPLRPGWVWVDADLHAKGRFPLKAIGLSDYRDGMYARLVKTSSNPNPTLTETEHA